MKNKKKAALMLTPLLAATVISGCGDVSDEPINRDVYASQEECLKDWNDGELCSKVPDEDEKEYRQNNPTVLYPLFWGPTYYGGQRTVTYKGQTISPVSRSTSVPSYGVTSRSSSFASRSVSSPVSSRSVSTGGFGGRSSGGGS